VGPVLDVHHIYASVFVPEHQTGSTNTWGKIILSSTFQLFMTLSCFKMTWKCCFMLRVMENGKSATGTDMMGCIKMIE
jgi:hypothetical protein